MFICLFQIPQQDIKLKPSLHSSEQKPNLKNDYRQIPNPASANGRPDAVRRNSVNNKHNSGNGFLYSSNSTREELLWNIFRVCVLRFISFITICLDMKIDWVVGYFMMLFHMRSLYIIYVGFEVLATVIVKSTFFWEHHIVQRGPDVSEGHIAPMLRVSEYAKQESNRSRQSLNYIVHSI
jgi:hypothetical protein